LFAVLLSELGGEFFNLILFAHRDKHSNLFPAFAGREALPVSVGSFCCAFHGDKDKR
jgi:hypothetical protein